VELAGRAIALVGVILGVLAVSLVAVSGDGDSLRYVDDGTVTAFLVILVSLTSWMPAEVGPDSLGGAMGAAAFGFFLFVPAVHAFDSFGALGPGAWLGICTVLIPIGLAVVWAARRESPAPVRSSASRATPGPGLVVALAGLILVLAGIWLPGADGGASYWNVSASGHALGLLLLLAVALNAVLLAAPHVSSRTLPSTGLLVAATTFGLVEAGLVSTAFEDFGSLGSGGWVEAAGGVLLLAGVLATRVAARAGEPVGEGASSAVAAP
jgi:hypothetical protein